jgi:hypothetical protein
MGTKEAWFEQPHSTPGRPPMGCCGCLAWVVLIAMCIAFWLVIGCAVLHVAC